MYVCYWWWITFFHLPLVAVSQGIFRRKQRPPIDGSWSSWGSWSSCYKNTVRRKHFYSQWENFDIQSRNRTCNSPKPLFGGRDCEPPLHRFRQCSCRNPLIGKNRIKDTYLSSSSNLFGYSPKEVRFSNTSTGWCAKTKLSYFTETYIQIDFQNFTKVGSIATLDNTKGRVDRYKLKYSLNGETWNYVQKDERSIVFTGNYLRGKRKMNNFSAHLVMKYLRVIPVNSYGLPCLRVEVYGCVFTCGTFLTAPFGGLIAHSSENHDQNCLWRVEVRNTTSLTFVFNVFYVLCKHGYLDFKDGDVAYNNSPLLKRVCLHDDESEIPHLKLNLNTVWVSFVSNSSSNEVGFNIKYFSRCSQKLQLTGGVPIHIKSPNFPNNYFDNLNCSWTVIPPPSSRRIQITVSDFSVESSDSSKKKCEDDVVDIIVENNGIKKKNASYCNGNRPPNKIIIVADAIVISFKSDVITSDKGFSFSVISGRRDVIPTNSNGKEIQSETEKISNNAKSNTGKVPQHRQNYTKKKVKPKDDTWTVIIICTFSSLVVILIAAVVYMNCRRFLTNRSAVNAHCAKVAEENRQKKNQKKSEDLHERNVFISPQSSPIKSMHDTTVPESEMFISSNIKITEATEAVGLSSNVKGMHSEDDNQFLDDVDVHNGIVVHSANGVDIHNDMQSPDEVDGEEVTSYGTSTPPCSPVKSIVVNCGSLDNDELQESVI